MSPHFGLPFKSAEDKRKKKRVTVEGDFTWFESAVNGSAVILSVLKDAATYAPIPYIRSAAATTLTIIQIGQLVKDNKADFRRLCEDAATLMVVVVQSRERSEDPEGWPGALNDAVESFLLTLHQIAEFAQAQVDRARFIRVVNSVADGIKIREYRERLAQATNRFEVSAHLLSYEVLRLVKKMMEEYKDRLNEQIAAPQEGGHIRPLPDLPDEDSEREEHPQRDEEPARRIADEEWLLEARRLEAEEREAKKKEAEAVNEKLQQILRLLEEEPRRHTMASRSDSEGEGKSSDDESIVRMVLKDAAEKRAGREARRKDRDAMFSSQMGGLSINGPGSPHHIPGYLSRGIPGIRAGVPARLRNTNSGNINTTTIYGSCNNNSTVTRIS